MKRKLVSKGILNVWASVKGKILSRLHQISKVQFEYLTLRKTLQWLHSIPGILGNFDRNACLVLMNLFEKESRTSK